MAHILPLSRSIGGQAGPDCDTEYPSRAWHAQSAASSMCRPCSPREAGCKDFSNYLYHNVCIMRYYSMTCLCKGHAMQRAPMGNHALKRASQSMSCWLLSRSSLLCLQLCFHRQNILIESSTGCLHSSLSSHGNTQMPMLDIKQLALSMVLAVQYSYFSWSVAPYRQELALFSCCSWLPHSGMLMPCQIPQSPAAQCSSPARKCAIRARTSKVIMVISWPLVDAASPRLSPCIKGLQGGRSYPEGNRVGRL